MHSKDIGVEVWNFREREREGRGGEEKREERKEPEHKAVIRSYERPSFSSSPLFLSFLLRPLESLLPTSLTPGPPESCL